MSLDRAQQIPRRRFLKGMGGSAFVSALSPNATKGMGPPNVSLSGTTAKFAVHPARGEVRFPTGETCYVVTGPRSHVDKGILARLMVYLEATLKRKPRVVSELGDVPRGRPLILIAYSGDATLHGVDAIDGHFEAFALVTGNCDGRQVVAAIANTDRGLKRAVQRLVIRSQQHRESLEIPESRLLEKPWIPEREYALCPWTPRYVRGVFFNPFADERLNILNYSSDQINTYVDMYDWFGFSGIQLMETSYCYGVLGSVEAFHGQMQAFARRAHENGQKVSLWVWAAEFAQFNWSDPDVTYTPASGHTAFDDPKVRKGFEKYYDYYSELAPYTDRLIAHFYDPGNLKDQQDVFKYMRLLEGKFRAKNAAVEMVVDMWAAKPDYFSKLVDNGFKDCLILQQPQGLSPAQRDALHEGARRLGMKLGMWSWGLTGCETDQLASMYVNCRLIKEFYQETKNGADKLYPLHYWSEMEAHHLNNIYSQYVAGQLLWNPDRDPHEILRELTLAIWGPSSGETVYDALKVIEDLRIAPNAYSYWGAKFPEYRLGTDDPAEDLQRAESALAGLNNLEVDPSFVPKLPLPVPPRTFVELMLPHLKQIRAFAQFRVELSELATASKNGAALVVITRRLTEIWKPIPEYDTWIGTFGQIERRVQENLVAKFAKEVGVWVDPPAWLRAEDSLRLLQKIQNVQLGKHSEWRFEPNQLNEFAWPADKLQDRFNKLISEGWVEELSKDMYRLANWEYYVH